MRVAATRTVACDSRTASPFQWILGLLVLLLTGCPSLISPYDQAAYQNATSLKAEMLALVEKGNARYKEHEQKLDTVLVEVDKAYEYAKGLPNNQITAEQWEILRNPEGHLIGGFVRTWQQQGTLSKAYVENKKKQLAQAFDYIICLEVNKKEPTSCKKMGDK